ncbi:MAG: ABC transporter permease, partial [Alphaproteobacteria bacterium]|nr:ABC transporter permease [Alphaproteobacteria bacterium]
MRRAASWSDRPAALVWRRFQDHRAAAASAIVLLVVAALVLASPAIEAGFGTEQSSIDIYNSYAAPTADHWLGTDEIGRDVMLRLLAGGRISLMVGLVAAIFASIIGTTVGLFAGYYGGRLDAVLMRLTDSVIALPLLPLLIILAAID